MRPKSILASLLLLDLLVSLPALGSTSLPVYFSQWGTFGSGDGQFGGASSVAVGPNGNVYVAEFQNHRIQVFSRTGAFITKWGTFGSGDGQFNQPLFVAIDAAGNVFVTDALNHRVQKFSSTGGFLGKWGSNGTGNGQFEIPRGIAVDAAGNVYVGDGNNNRIQKFTNAGGFLASWGSTGSGNGQFNIVAGVAVDADGNVYVSDFFNSRIQKFTGAGVFVAKWGTPGSAPGQFAEPWGIKVGPDGHVQVADRANNRIQRFTSTGAFVQAWGAFGSGNGQFAYPFDLAFDAAGGPYVVDLNNNRIQRFVQPANVASVSDVGNDQGRQVRIRILRCSMDLAGSELPITRYDVFRRIQPGQAPAGGVASPASVAIAGWDYVGTTPAYGESEYTVVVPTLADSNASGSHPSEFFVRAATATITLFLDSAPDTGWSVDNLPPIAPAPFTGTYAGGTASLQWQANEEPDVASYRLYRGTSSGFVPGPSNLVATIAGTDYADAAGAPYWYKLGAVDVNGNEGPRTALLPGGTVAVEGVGSRELQLAPPSPNPIGRVATLRFSLPRPSTVALALFDAAGRKVSDVASGAFPAGEHAVTWRRAEGAERLRDGIYFLRLETEGRVIARSVALID